MFRSLLFIPGNNPSMLQNADVFITDAVIFDLEDAISIKEKNNARNLVRNYLLTSSVLPRNVVLRVNSFDSQWFKKDIELLLTGKIDYLLVPKIDNDTLKLVDNYLNDFEIVNKLQKTKLIALIETVKGVVQLPLFAENNRLFALFLGAEDLANNLEIKRTEESKEIFYARSQVIYNAISNDLIPIDTPYTNINNSEGLKIDCEKAFSFGMKAKAAIHPNQLETINQVFSPSSEDIEWAKGVVEKFNENPSLGVFQYKGKMIDKPIINRAQKILEKANLFDLL